MAEAWNTAEGGSDGTTVTTANSGGSSGDAFDSVVINGVGTLAYRSAHAAHGGLSYGVNPDISQLCYVQWSTTIGTQTDFYGRCYLYLTANPSSNTINLLRFLNGTALAAAVRVSAAGKLQAIDAAGTQQGGTTAVVSLNTWIRIGWHVVTNATTGSIEVKLYNTPDSLTPTETLTLTGLNTNTQATVYRFGMAVLAGVDFPEFFIDDLGITTAGYPGPAAQATSDLGTGADVVLVAVALPLTDAGVDTESSAIAEATSDAGVAADTSSLATPVSISVSDAGVGVVVRAHGNGFEGGAPGQQITESNPNTPGGDAFDIVNDDAFHGAIATYEALHPAHGSQAAKLPAVADAGGVAARAIEMWWDFPTPPGFPWPQANEIWTRLYFYVPGTFPASATVQMMHVLPVFSQQQATVTLGRLGITVASLGDVASLSTPAGLVGDTLYRLEVHILAGDYRDALIEIRLFEGDSTTALYHAERGGEGTDPIKILGPFETFIAGRLAGGVSFGDFYIDDVAYGFDGWLGPEYGGTARMSADIPTTDSAVGAESHTLVLPVVESKGPHLVEQPAARLEVQEDEAEPGVAGELALRT